MNRQVRRQAERQLRRAMGRQRRAMKSDDPVRLIGGPMNGWLVTPDAPALHPDWWKGITEPSGRYELAGRDVDGVRAAEWKEGAE